MSDKGREMRVNQPSRIKIKAIIIVFFPVICNLLGMNIMMKKLSEAAPPAIKHFLNLG